MNNSKEGSDEGVAVRFDPRVTLALLVTLLAQAGGVFIWAGAQGERLTALERHNEKQTLAGERLARLEVQVEQARASLARIEHRLER